MLILHFNLNGVSTFHIKDPASGIQYHLVEVCAPELPRRLACIRLKTFS